MHSRPAPTIFTHEFSLADRVALVSGAERGIGLEMALALVEAAGLTTTGAHGIRIFSDLVPSALVDSDADRAALLDLERAVVSHPEFAVLADLGHPVE